MVAGNWIGDASPWSINHSSLLPKSFHLVEVCSDACWRRSPCILINCPTHAHHAATGDRYRHREVSGRTASDQSVAVVLEDLLGTDKKEVALGPSGHQVQLTLKIVLAEVKPLRKR